MLSDLISLDRSLTLAVNGWHSPWADTLMWYVSKAWIWIPLYVLLLALIVKEYRKASWVVIAGLVLLVGIVDWTSVHWFKDVFMRLRPGHDPVLEGLIRIPYDRGGLYGFISSHASNHFAIAVFVTAFLGHRYKILHWGVLYFWAALICYSRIYLGRHFVGDVVVGSVWGVLWALLLIYLTRLSLSRLYPSMNRYRFRRQRR